MFNNPNAKVRTHLRNVASGNNFLREVASSWLTDSLAKHSATLMAKMPKVVSAPLARSMSLLQLTFKNYYFE
jgi:hypothetical protein